MVPRSNSASLPSPYKAALDAAMDEIRAIHSTIEKSKAEVSQLEARMRELTLLVRNLTALMSEEERAEYVDTAGDLQPASPANPRVSEVYENIVYLFSSSPQRTLWKAAEVQTALNQSGKNVDPKAVYNVLNYLERTGKLRRVSRGHYVISDLGISVHTSEEFKTNDPTHGECS